MTNEECVLEFTAKQLCIRKDKLRLTDRLRVDLGVDGDDALEFVDEFAKHFDVDLSSLQAHWDEYFGSEGAPPTAILSVTLIGILPAIVLMMILPAFPLWAFILVTLIALIIWATMNARSERKNPSSKQITLADLANTLSTKSFHAN